LYGGLTSVQKRFKNTIGIESKVLNEYLFIFYDNFNIPSNKNIFLQHD
jgi:hypothetical protein